ncbi:MAG: phosphoglucomutase/phosphomannomutase family protein, partial [Deltaproteobacteria bacterium]
HGASIRQRLDALHARYGKILTRRINYRLSEARKAALLASLAEGPTTFAGRRVLERNTLDGTKLFLDDGSWVLMRPSGTEPVVRFYIETTSAARLEELAEAGRRFIEG